MANSVIKHIQVGPSGTAYDIVNQKVKVGTTTFDDNAVVSITGSNGVSVVGATGTNPTITVKGPSNYVIGGSQTTTSSADGGSNVFTFNKSDGTSATFTVKNGSKGSVGAVGPTGATGPTGPAPDLTKYPTLAGTNAFSGSNTFKVDNIDTSNVSTSTAIDESGLVILPTTRSPGRECIKIGWGDTSHNEPMIIAKNSSMVTRAFKFNSSASTLSGVYSIATTDDIDVTAAGSNTFTGSNWFKGNGAIITTQNGIRIGFSNGVSPDADSSIYSIDKYGFLGPGKNLSLQTIKFPDLSTFSTATHTIPLNDTNNTFTGTNLFKGGTTQFLTSSAGLNDPKTDVGAYGILCQTGGNVGTYYKDGKITNGTNTLTLPLKTGTVALTSDVNIYIDKTISGIIGPSTTVSFAADEMTQIYNNYDKTIIHLISNEVGTTEPVEKFLYPYGKAQETNLFIFVSPRYSNTGYMLTVSGTAGAVATATIERVTFGVGDVTAAGNNTFTGTNKFYGSVNIRESTASEGNFVEITGTGYIHAFNNEDNSVSGGKGNNLILHLPLNKEGNYTIATTDDIDVTLAGNNRFTGSNSFTSGISIIEDANNKTIYNSGHIANYTQSGSYTLYLPSKSGLMATTNDIPIKTATLSGTTLSITLS